MKMIGLSSIPKEEYKIERSWVERGEYIAPNRHVRIREDMLERYFYWIHERQEIWYKRNILKEPAPWTEDPILQSFRFTHPIRDIDTVTIYYRENLLPHVTEDEDSKINLLLNTMIFRIFVKPESWECFGYLDYRDPQIYKKLDLAYDALVEEADRGVTVFTGAYMVNPMGYLKKIYPLGRTSKFPKIDNAFRLIYHLVDNIEMLYDTTVKQPNDIVEQMEVFKSIPGVGAFSAYEWACDLCLAERYTGVKMVPWDDNSGTNVGPGAKKGIDVIFANRGNFNHTNAILFLASLAPYFFKKFEYADTMKWPAEITEFNLRMVEHSLCEFMKYIKTFNGTGRPRQRLKIVQLDGVGKTQ